MRSVASTLLLSILMTSVIAFKVQAATITVVTTESDFRALVGEPVFSEDFSSFVGTSISSGADFGPFSVTGPGISSVDAVTTGFSSVVDINGTYLLTGSSVSSPVVFQFDAPILGFAALISHMISAPSVTIDGVGTAALPSVLGTQFVGFVSDTLFTSFSLFTSSPDGYGIDEVLFSSSAPQAVPTPATLALFVVGLAGLRIRRRIQL
ncbi:MAG: PEP-CTERM sorting domain-containing protein [Motiliproteus sp.]